ncbi:MAG TPA: glycosyltransferase [Xanthobacteraceae bacterium]
MHRVRTAIPYYKRFGWTPTVLAITPESSGAVSDAVLAKSVPPDVGVVQVTAWDERRCRRLGFGQLAYRSLLPLYRAGSALLERGRYDVVLFSSTVFLSFILGPLWARRYGCKLVYDFQDPWYREQLNFTRATAPGSWWKYRVDHWSARYLEKFAIKSADHIISVSAGYVRDFMKRYAWLDASKFTVLPFAAATEDYAFLRMHGIEHGIFQPDSALVRWVSAGRAGPDMDPILAVLFEATAQMTINDPRYAERLRLHFVGTNYAPPERTYKLVEPLARRFGVQNLVEEHPTRVPYFQALALYAQSDAVLLIGSLSADYTASKLFNCIMSKKPVLALFHRSSLVAEIARGFPNVFLATFEQSPTEPEFHAQVRKGIEWLRAPKFDASVIEEKLEPWSAEELTRRQCAIFDEVCGVTPTPRAERGASDARS